VVARFHPELANDEGGQRGVRRSLRCNYPRQCFLHLSLEVDHEGDHDIFLGLEIVVYGSFADVGCLRNLIHSDVCNAMPGEQIHSLSNDPLANGALLSLSSR